MSEELLILTPLFALIALMLLAEFAEWLIVKVFNPLRLSVLYYEDDGAVCCFHCKNKMVACGQSKLKDHDCDDVYHFVSVYRCQVCDREVSIPDEDIE